MVVRQRSVYNQRMGLTPKRVQRVLDRWDEVTAQAQEPYLTVT